MANDGLGQAIHGYSRAEVDDFLHAAAGERVRLETEISDARGRINRARSAIGMHRVMVAMLMETQRELTALRQDAEAQADQIVSDAEREAAHALSGAAFPSPSPTPNGVATPTPVIDLGRAEHEETRRFVESSMVAEVGFANDESRDEYFDFLRGALADESPLGPGPE